MKTKRVICIMLVMMLLVLVTGTTVSDRQSELLRTRDAEIYLDASGNIRVWFEVRAKDEMDILGATLIRLQMQNDDGSWSTVYSWPESSRTCGENIYRFDNTLTYYNPVEGANYRAVVKFYAETDGVSESLNFTTNELIA